MRRWLRREGAVVWPSGAAAVMCDCGTSPRHDDGAALDRCPSGCTLQAHHPAGGGGSADSRTSTSMPRFTAIAPLACCRGEGV